MTLPAAVTPRVLYVTVFLLAAGVGLAAARRARRLDHRATRAGLTWLLVTSAGWALAHVGRLAADSVQLQVAFYYLGLVLGLATVGAWLYFCSAYAGHDYHRNREVRLAAVGSYLGVVALKLTNPIHGQYFTVRPTTGFPGMLIQQGTLHWVVTALAYALTAVGFYLVYEMYRESQQRTLGLSVLVALTSFPVLLDLVGYGSPYLLALSYEPIGVAAFGVGVLYVAEERFFSVSRFGRQQIIDSLSDPVVLLDNDDVVRDYNAAASEVFDLASAEGRPIETVVPALADAVGAAGTLTEIETATGAERYYLVTTSPLTVGTATVGRGVVCTDVTDIERQRRELERQNDQLDDFAEAINHELRNSLNVVEGYLGVIEAAIGGDDPDRSRMAVDRASDSIDRMVRIVHDLSVLARYGQTVDDRTDCRFEPAARRAWDGVGEPGLELRVEGEAPVRADRARLEELFATLFEFAAASDASRVSLTRTDDGFAYSDDGTPLDDSTRVFEYGEAVPDAESGMLLPTVRMLARVHEWTVEADPGHADGARIVVSVAEPG